MARAAPESHRMGAWLILSFLLLAGLGFRLGGLDEPLWLDELHTAWCVSESLADVAPRAIQGNQSPLFFWLEYPAFHGLGKNRLALRIISLAASVLLLGSIPLLVYRWSGSLSGSLSGAILAAGLAALDDKFWFYAVEARPYALVQLVALWQMALFIRLLSADKNSANRLNNAGTWFCILTIGLFYLHPTTILLLACQVMVCVLVGAYRWSSTQRWNWRHTWPPWLLICLTGCVPGLILIWRLAGHASDWSVIGDPGRFGLLVLADVLIWLAIPVTVWWITAGKSPESESPALSVSQGRLACLATAGLVPPALVWLLAELQIAPLAQYRFVISSFGLIIVLAGLLVNQLPGIRSRLSVTIAVLSLAAVTHPLLPDWPSRGSLPNQRHENWQAISRQLNEDRLPVAIWPNLVEDRRFAGSELGGLEQAYYRFAVSGIYALDGIRDGRPVTARSLYGPRLLTPQQLAQFQQSSGGWLLVRARAAAARNVVQRVHRQFGDRWTVEIEDYSQPPLYLFRLSVHPNSSR